MFRDGESRCYCRTAGCRKVAVIAICPWTAAPWLCAGFVTESRQRAWCRWGLSLYPTRRSPDRRKPGCHKDHLKKNLRVTQTNIFRSRIYLEKTEEESFFRSGIIMKGKNQNWREPQIYLQLEDQLGKQCPGRAGGGRRRWWASPGRGGRPEWRKWGRRRLRSWSRTLSRRWPGWQSLHRRHLTRSLKKRRRLSI